MIFKSKQINFLFYEKKIEMLFINIVYYKSITTILISELLS